MNTIENFTENCRVKFNGVYGNVKFIAPSNPVVAVKFDELVNYSGSPAGKYFYFGGGNAESLDALEIIIVEDKTNMSWDTQDCRRALYKNMADTIDKMQKNRKWSFLESNPEFVEKLKNVSIEFDELAKIPKAPINGGFNDALNELEIKITSDKAELWENIAEHTHARMRKWKFKYKASQAENACLRNEIALLKKRVKELCNGGK